MSAALNAAHRRRAADIDRNKRALYFLAHIERHCEGCQRSMAAGIELGVCRRGSDQLKNTRLRACRHFRKLSSMSLGACNGRKVSRAQQEDLGKKDSRS